MPVPWVRKAYARRTEKLPVRVHIRQRNAHKVTAVMDLKRWLITLTASLSGVLAVLLLCRESVAAQGVRDGIDLCITSVIPALFPFFAAAQLLVSLGAAEVLGRGAGPLFRRLFGIGGAGASAFLLGLIGGYPVGAKTTESLVRQGLLPPEDGALLLENLPLLADALGPFGSPVSDSTRALVDERTHVCLTIIYGFDGAAPVEEALRISAAAFARFCRCRPLCDPWCVQG